MTAPLDREYLDDLLDQSSPGTPVFTNNVADEVTRLQVATTPAFQAPRRSKRWVGPIVTGLITFALVGGAAAAAATTAGLWTPWAENPVATRAYTAPSGAQCEARVGDVQATDPKTVEAVESFYRNINFDDLLTEDAVEDAIAQIRSEDNYFQNKDGSRQRAGYGTSHYSADEEYEHAVNIILDAAMDNELAGQGIDGAASALTFRGELHCFGADW